jgi:hypothetical protein
MGWQDRAPALASKKAIDRAILYSLLVKVISLAV